MRGGGGGEGREGGEGGRGAELVGQEQLGETAT